MKTVIKKSDILYQPTHLQKFLCLVFTGFKSLPDNNAWQNRISIPSSDGKTTYVVAQRKSLTEWGCSCKGWIYHRNCYHLSDIMPYIEAFKQYINEKKHTRQS